MVRSLKQSILGVVSIVAVTACGGGSSNGQQGSTHNTAHYDLTSMVYLPVQTGLSGTFNGAPAQGQYESHYTGDLVYNGIPLSVRSNTLNLGSYTETNNMGYYMGAHFGTRDSARTCTVTDTSGLVSPQDVQVGYRFNALFHCTDGANMEIAKSLEDAGDNNAVYTNTSVLHTGTQDITIVEKFTITPQAQVIAYERSETGGNVTYHLSSTN